VADFCEVKKINCAWLRSVSPVFFFRCNFLQSSTMSVKHEPLIKRMPPQRLTRSQTRIFSSSATPVIKKEEEQDSTNVKISEVSPHSTVATPRVKEEEIEPNKVVLSPPLADKNGNCNYHWHKNT
jgi:hypothetical protein